MSHEPLTIINRLLNKLCDYILLVLDISENKMPIVENNKVRWFLGFFVARFLVIVVSQFLGLLVSSFLGCFVSSF